MEHVDKKTGEVIDDRVCSYNSRGEEILHDAPLALPVGFKRPQTLQERMKYLLRNELVQRELDAAGVESFDEADDFNVDEPDPLDGTPYEDCFEPEIPGIAAREQEIRAGAVADRPVEKKEKARETIRNYSRFKRGYSRKHNPAKSGSSGEGEQASGDRPSLPARSKGRIERSQEEDQMDTDGDEL